MSSKKLDAAIDALVDALAELRSASLRVGSAATGRAAQKLSKCTYFREEREESRVGRESLPRTAIVAANQAGAGDLET